MIEGDAHRYRAHLGHPGAPGESCGQREFWKKNAVFEQRGGFSRNWVTYPAQGERPFDNHSYVKIPARVAVDSGFGGSYLNQLLGLETRSWHPYARFEGHQRPEGPDLGRRHLEVRARALAPSARGRESGVDQFSNKHVASGTCNPGDIRWRPGRVGSGQRKKAAGVRWIEYSRANPCVTSSTRPLREQQPDDPSSGQLHRRAWPQARLRREARPSIGRATT